MFLVIGYAIVIILLGLDFYYKFYVNKGKQTTYIYTPFGVITAQYWDLWEEQQIHEQFEKKSRK